MASICCRTGRHAYSSRRYRIVATGSGVDRRERWRVARLSGEGVRGGGCGRARSEAGGVAGPDSRRHLQAGRHERVDRPRGGPADTSDATTWRVRPADRIGSAARNPRPLSQSRCQPHGTRRPARRPSRRGGRASAHRRGRAPLPSARGSCASSGRMVTRAACQSRIVPRQPAGSAIMKCPSPLLPHRAGAGAVTTSCRCGESRNRIRG